MTGEDDLGMPPKVVVNLATKLLETDILPKSCDCESDTDLPPPPALDVMEVDVATRNILKLLPEILSGQSPASEAAGMEPGPELSVLPNGKTPTGVAMPLHPSTALQPLFQFGLPTLYPAGHGQHFHAHNGPCHWL